MMEKSYDIDNHFLMDMIGNPEWMCDNMIITTEGDVHPFDSPQDLVDNLYEMVTSQDSIGEIEYIFLDGKKKDLLLTMSLKDSPTLQNTH